MIQEAIVIEWTRGFQWITIRDRAITGTTVYSQVIERPHRIVISGISSQNSPPFVRIPPLFCSPPEAKFFDYLGEQNPLEMHQKSDFWHFLSEFPPCFAPFENKGGILTRDTTDVYSETTKQS